MGGVHNHHRAAGHRRRERRAGRGHEPAQPGGDLVGGGGHPGGEGGRDLAGPLDRVDGDAGQHQRPDRVQAELEGGRDPEVGPGAAQAPEQLRLGAGVGPDPLALGRDQLHRDQVVEGQPVPAGQPPDPAAEGQPTDAGVGDVPGRAGQPIRLGPPVELPEQGAPGRRGHPALGVDHDPGHRRQVDHDAAVAGREPGVAVAAAAHGDQQLPFAGVAHRRDHVLDPGTAGDERRPGVGGRVPHRPRPVIARVPGHHDPPWNRSRKAPSARPSSMAQRYLVSRRTGGGLPGSVAGHR